MGHGVPVAHGLVPVAHPVAHVAHPVAHAVHHAPVVHHAPAPAYAPAPVPAPVVPAPAPYKPAPAYKPAPYVEPEGKDEPYSYQYGVADDYSKANFNADGAGVVTGSYSVALPDGRTQHVKYTSDHYNGYVAEVTYEGEPVYPEAKPYVPAPAPAYRA